MGRPDRVQPARPAASLPGRGTSPAPLSRRHREPRRYPRRSAASQFPGVLGREGRPRGAYARACPRARARGARERRVPGRDPVARRRRALRFLGTQPHHEPDAARAHRSAGGCRRGCKIPALRRAFRDRPDPRRRRRARHLPLGRVHEDASNVCSLPVGSDEGSPQGGRGFFDRHPQSRFRVRQARQAPAPPRGPGDRRLLDDRGWRQGDGVPVGRQGQLRAARRAHEAAREISGPFRARCREPRPAPPRVSRARAARVSDRARRAFPHRGAGHLQRGEARHSRGQDDVRAVLAAAPRRALPRGRGAGRQQDRAGPSPRRYPRDVLPESLPRGEAEGHGAEARLRRRPAHRDPPARLRRGGGPRGLRGAARVPDHSLRPVRLPGAAAEKAGQGDAARVGEEESRPPRNHLQRAHQRGSLASARSRAVRFHPPAAQRRIPHDLPDPSLEMTLKQINATKKITSFHPPQRTLMGPGPTEIHPRVLTTMSQPAIGYLDPVFVEMMEELKSLLRYVYQTDNALTFPVSGPGSVGMEYCFVNLVAPGDKVIVCRNGVFGGRMLENVERAGGVAVVVDDAWGHPVDLQKVEDAFRKNPDAKLLAFVHAETSTGAQSDAKALTQIAHKHHAMAIVDAVTSLGGTPVRVDDWNVDAIYSASQKCLSCTPGLSPVSFSERAVERVKKRKDQIHSWFMDMNLLSSYWCATARTYHHTAPTNSLFP